METTLGLQSFQAYDGILAQKRLSVFQNVPTSLKFRCIVFKWYAAECLSSNQVEAHPVIDKGPF